MTGLMLKAIPMPSPGVIVAIALAAACFFGGWSMQGMRKDSVIQKMQIESMEEAAATATAIAERRRAIVEIEESRRSQVRLAAELAVERNREAEIVERIIEVEVDKYDETDNADIVCVDPVGLRVHDQAAAGTDTGLPTEGDAAAAFDEAARAVKNADFIGIVVENYGICRRELGRLTELQEWELAQAPVGH